MESKFINNIFFTAFPDTDAQAIYQALHGTEQGNQIIVNGLNSLLAIQDSVVSYQKDAAGIFFLLQILVK